MTVKSLTEQELQSKKRVESSLEHFYYEHAKEFKKFKLFAIEHRKDTVLITFSTSKKGNDFVEWGNIFNHIKEKELTGDD